MMADTDKRRMTNYNFYTEHKWGKASNYTLCLNSSQLDMTGCEKIIMECIKQEVYTVYYKLLLVPGQEY